MNMIEMMTTSVAMKDPVRMAGLIELNFIESIV